MNRWANLKPYHDVDTVFPCRYRNKRQSIAGIVLSYIFAMKVSMCNIMAEGFRFMPLGLVRLGTFRLSAWVAWVQHWHRCSRAFTWSRRVTQRCHNSPIWETRLQSPGDVTHRRRAVDVGNLKKVSRVENWTPCETVGFRLLAEAFGRCRTRWGWADENARIERLCLSLSLCRKTFKLKGNKKFRT